MIDDENIENTIEQPSNLSPRMLALMKEEREQKLRDWNFYQAIKKDSFENYLSPKVQKQMMTDALENPNFGMPND